MAKAKKQTAEELAPIPLKITEIQSFPASYSTEDGSIMISFEGGTAPYYVSVDNGYTWKKVNHKPTISIDVYGGNYQVRLKDSLGAITPKHKLFVEKELSTIQAAYLNNLYLAMGIEVRAAQMTEAELGIKLPTLNVTRWRKYDPDFAAMVAETKQDASEFMRDYLVSQALKCVSGGIPIYSYIANPNALRDDNGKMVNPQDRIKIQVAETQISGDMVKFLLSTKFKDEFSTRVETTGIDDARGRIIAIAPEDIIEEDDDDDYDASNFDDEEEED